MPTLRLQPDDLLRAMQDGLKILSRMGGFHPISMTPLRGEFIAEAVPRSWRWKIRYMCDGDSFAKDVRGAWVTGEGTFPRDPRGCARVKRDIQVGAQLPVDQVFEELASEYAKQFPKDWSEINLDDSMDGIFAEIPKHVQELKNFQWSRAPGLPRGARLSIRLTRRNSWWRLYGFKVSPEGYVEGAQTVFAEKDLYVFTRYGQVSVNATVSPGTNLAKLRVRLTAELNNKLGQSEAATAAMKNSLQERLLSPGMHAERKRYLKIEKAITQIKKANNHPGTMFLPPWAPREKPLEPARDYYDRTLLARLADGVKVDTMKEPWSRGAILQIALYLDGTIKTEGWVLDLTPWRVDATRLENNYLQVHTSHKEGITLDDGMRFHETLIWPDRRRAKAWAVQVAEEFMKKFDLIEFDDDVEGAK